MQPVEAPQSNDPAPSRWSYRMHRLWLRPGFRRLVRGGIPVLLLAAAAGWYFHDGSKLEILRDEVAETRRAVRERPEFMVNLMAVDGASPELTQAVRAEVALELPISSFDLDLDVLRDQVLGFDAIAEARLRIRPGGVLQIEIEERQPAVVWRGRDGLTLLDPQGHRIAGIAARADWPELPLVAGDAADAAIPEALELIAAAAPLEKRLRGLVRVGARRWDLVLDRDQRILLPEDDPVIALNGLIALDQARDLMDRDIALVDLRNPRRPTVRLADHAITELRRIRSLEAGEITQ